ncbi:MAG: hypothetical protein ABLT11_12160, partial [Candidatus Acidiferrum sp.]
ACIFLALTAPAALFARPQADPHHPAQDSARGAVQTQMRNVLYHFTTSSAVLIKTLNGELQPNDGADFPVFENKDSFRLSISAAEISIASADLASIFNSYAFARANSPLSGVSMTIENGKLKIKGKLHDVGVIPFETEGFLSPTPAGKILLRIGKVRALHVPVKGVMNLFGVEIADLIKNGKVPGVASSGDNLILDPSLVFPAPHMEGKITAVRVEGATIVLIFGQKDQSAKFRQGGNYMSFHGNRLRFGKLTMTDADMILIDMDPSDPFDFFLDRYKDQLVAGHAKLTPSSGLRILVKDFNKLGKSSAGPSQKAVEPAR